MLGLCVSACSTRRFSSSLAKVVHQRVGTAAFSRKRCASPVGAFAAAVVCGNESLRYVSTAGGGGAWKFGPTAQPTSARKTPNVSARLIADLPADATSPP